MKSISSKKYPKIGALALGFCSLIVPVFATQTIVVDPNTTYHTHDGWEAATEVEQLITNGYEFPDVTRNAEANADALVNQMGINRVRLQIQTHNENTVDVDGGFANGTYTFTEYKWRFYQKINDNNDPFVADPAGFHFTGLDERIEGQVLPMKKLLEARGERLWINIQVVDFRNGNASQGFFSDISFGDNPEEYAEFVVEAVKHMDRKYGIVPDALELVLEPDNTKDWGGVSDATLAGRLGGALIAVHNRLTANGYTLKQYIAPGTKSLTKAIGIIDVMMQDPQAKALLDVFSYHLYNGNTQSNRQAIWQRAVTHGKKTAQLEYTFAEPGDLMKDVDDSHVSAWQRWAAIANHDSAYLDPIESDPDNLSYDYHFQTGPMVQFMKYVRLGALEIEASSSNAAAYINKNGGYTVIVQNLANNFGDITVQGLPAGTYGVTSSGYVSTSGNTLKMEQAYSDIVITGGQDLVVSPLTTSRSWQAGLLTVFQKSGANMDTVVPTDPSNFQVTQATASQVDLSWTASTDNASIEGYDIYRDGRLYAETTGAGTSFSDVNVSGASAHTYQVRARDTGGNISSLTTELAATTASDLADTVLTYTNHGTHIEITDCDVNASGGLIVPDTLESLPVTLVAANAFKDCTQLTSVILPATITSIGDSAFEGCVALERCELPSALSSLGQAAFKGCSVLKAIDVPSGVATIAAETFQNASWLREVTLPNGLNSIGDSAFEACSGLREILLPASLLSIGADSFKGSALYIVELGPNVNSVGNRAFANCHRLVDIKVDAGNATFENYERALYNEAKTILLAHPSGISRSNVDDAILPATLDTIAPYAFMGSSKSDYIYLPEGVTTVQANAFEETQNLKKVFFPSTLTSIGTDAFNNNIDLQRAQFRGDAPTMSMPVFSNVDASFAIYFWNSQSGFTEPTWMGYSSVGMGDTVFTNWLTENHYAYNMDRSMSLSADGLSILAAYALNLDETADNSQNVPTPYLSGSDLKMDFYAIRSGVTYEVEVSSDMQNWTTSGVTVSAPNGSGISEASVPLSSGHRFMRVKLTDQ